MKKYRTLKRGVKMANPYWPDLDITSPEYALIRAMDQIFVTCGEVFEGDISDHVELAFEAADGRAERWVIRNIYFEALTKLAKMGYVTLNGPIFTPTAKLLSRYLTDADLSE